MMRFVLRLRAFQADTETLQIMVDIPIMQMRHRLVNPPLKSRHLDFHSAPAYATDDMVMALVIRAFTVERLVIDVDDVDPPCSDISFRLRYTVAVPTLRLRHFSTSTICCAETKRRISPNTCAISSLDLLTRSFTPFSASTTVRTPFGKHSFAMNHNPHIPHARHTYLFPC